MASHRSTVTDVSEAVLHYKRKLTRHLEDESPDIVLHCLDKLELIPVNISILQETGIGKIVNNLKKSETADDSVVERAREIVQKWKEIVANEEQEMNQATGTEEEQDNSDGDDGQHVSEAEEPVQDDPVSEEDPLPQLSEDDELGQDASVRSKPELKKSSHHESKPSKKSRSDDREKSRDSSSKSKSNEDQSSRNSRKKKKKDKEKDREVEKEKEKEKSKRSEEKKKESRKRKRDSSHSEDDNEKSRKRKYDADEKSTKSKNSKKTSSENNGFAEAIKSVDRSNATSSVKKDSKKSHQTSRTSTSSPKPEDVPKVSSTPVHNDIQPSRPKQPNPVPVTLPPSRNYSHLTDGKTDDEALSALISMSKTSRRTAVYSGSKRSAYEKVPSLIELCRYKLQENVDHIVDTKGIKFEVLEPILERAKPDTLMTIEDYNPYLTESTGHLWERICKRQFPKEKRQEFEAWREMYERCTDARKKKLDFLTERVYTSYQNVRDSHRKTKLAYVDGVSRATRPFVRPSDRNGASQSSSSHGSGPSVKKPSAPSTSVPAPKPVRESSSSSSSSSASKKPKIAPMMAKTLRMVRGLKTNFRR